MTARTRSWGEVLTILALACGFLWGGRAGAQDRTQDPTQWAAAMQTFASADATCPPPANAIVFTGSSSIFFWKTLREDMAPLNVLNRGFGGSTMQDAIYWLNDVVLKYKPRAVVLYEGDNDIGHYNMRAEQVLEEFKKFTAKVRKRLPQASIYFLAIKPSISRFGAWPEMKRANELIQAFCQRQRKLHFIDVATPLFDSPEAALKNDIFQPDQLHLNAKGYELWTSIIKPILLEREGAASDEVGSNAMAASSLEKGARCTG